VTLTTATAPGTRKVIPANPEELQERADGLLTVMSSIRRSGGLLARRPVELSSLTGSQLDLVRVILRRPGLSVNEAAEELRLAPNTVSTLVRQLTDQNLVIRSSDAVDRRVACLDLTPTMRRKVRAFRDRRLAALVAAMTRLSASEQRSLAGAVTLLDDLAAQLLEEEHAYDRPPDRKST
jgi:DNA-binding MarR family transcriptional regulator